MAQMQASLDMWEGGLRASGGALVPEKSHWYLIKFLWDSEGCMRYATCQDEPATLSVRGADGQTTPLTRLEPSDARQTLGVHLALDGNNKAEFKFPTVLYKYRPNINPVRAIYFDVKALEVLYDKKNKNHRWLLSLFEDKKWYKRLMNAIHTDIISVENLINKNKLRWTEMKMLTLPVKIHEAEQLLQDLNTWLYEFEVFND